MTFTFDSLLDFIGEYFFGFPYNDLIFSSQIFCVLIVFSFFLFLFIFYVKFVFWLFRLAGG